MRHPQPETRRKLSRWTGNALILANWAWHFSFRAFWGLALAAFASYGLWSAWMAASALNDGGGWSECLKRLLAAAICLVLAYAISLGQSYPMPEPPSRSDASGPETR